MDMVQQYFLRQHCVQKCATYVKTPGMIYRSIYIALVHSNHSVLSSHSNQTNAPINGIPHSPTPGLDGEIVGI